MSEFICELCSQIEDTVDKLNLHIITIHPDIFRGQALEDAVKSQVEDTLKSDEGNDIKPEPMDDEPQEIEETVQRVSNFKPEDFLEVKLDEEEDRTNAWEQHKVNSQFQNPNPDDKSQHEKSDDHFQEMPRNSGKKGTSKEEVMWDCQYCVGKQFVKHNYIRHHQACHPDKPSFPCDKCDKVFPKKEFLSGHIGHMHNIKDTICEICKETFLSNYSLSSHLKLCHTDEYACDECNEIVIGRKGLQDHMKKKHQGFDIQCEHCPASFKLHKRLLAHIRRAHTKKDPDHKCDVCKEVFTCKLLLNRHLKLEHPSEKFQCTHCGAPLLSASSLRTHLKSQHSDQLAAKCDHCPETFSSSKSLKHHIIVAHSEKPWQCQVCSKGYQHFDSLRDHVKITGHTGVGSKTLGEIVCKMCSKQFPTVEKMQNHFKFFHSAKNWLCKVCEKGFARRYKLTNHIKKVHKDLLDAGEVKK